MRQFEFRKPRVSGKHGCGARVLRGSRVSRVLRAAGVELGGGFDGTRWGKCEAMHGCGGEKGKGTRHMWKAPVRGDSSLNADVSSSSSSSSSTVKSFCKVFLGLRLYFKLLAFSL